MFRVQLVVHQPRPPAAALQVPSWHSAVVVQGSPIPLLAGGGGGGVVAHSDEHFVSAHVPTALYFATPLA